MTGRALCHPFHRILTPVYQKSTEPSPDYLHRRWSGEVFFLGGLPLVYRCNFLTHNRRIFSDFLRFLQRLEPRKYRDTGVAGQKR